MLVICRDNTSERGGLLKIGETYFVEKIECIDNQIYYQLRGFNTLFCYWNFELVDELRNKKLEKLGI